VGDINIDGWPRHGDQSPWRGEQTLAGYVGDLAKELSKMARSAHYEALANLLDQASREAQDIDARAEAPLHS
jgi:hypothetical protein